MSTETLNALKLLEMAQKAKSLGMKPPFVLLASPEQMAALEADPAWEHTRQHLMQGARP